MFCGCHHSLAPAGDRSGHVILWDTSAADVSWRMKNVHQGHITAMAWFNADDSEWGGSFVTGGQVRARGGMLVTGWQVSNRGAGE